MSEHTSFRIDGYTLGSTPTYADPETLSLFQEADKHVRIRGIVAGRRWTSSWLAMPDAERALSQAADGRWLVRLPPGAVWESVDDEEVPDGDAGEEVSVDGESESVIVPAADHRSDPATPAVSPPPLDQEIMLDSNHPIAGHAYVSTVARVRDRLDAMGFTLAAAADVLAEHGQTRLTDLASREEHHPVLSRRDQEERDALESLTPDTWAEAYRWIAARSVYNIDQGSRATDLPFSSPYSVPAAEAPLLVRHLLDDHRDHNYGFPHGDVRYLYRAALEACAPDAPVVLDLSRVSFGWTYDVTDAVVEDARQARLADYPGDAPTIVLTEGVSDQRALQAALRLLYPHLEDLYTFLDFEAMRVRGGAPAVVGLVKAFAAAGIANRIIALLDNDTAAHIALRDLRTLTLPRNIRVLTYPPLPLATAYPSVGPQGTQPVDVNGSAGSLEMYFGEDVLRTADGAFTPVQWGSYEPVVQRHYGELHDKARLQKRFEEKAAAAAADPRVIEAQDWSGMRAILEAIRHAFD